MRLKFFITISIYSVKPQGAIGTLIMVKKNNCQITVKVKKIVFDFDLAAIRRRSRENMQVIINNEVCKDHQKNKTIKKSNKSI